MSYQRRVFCTLAIALLALTFVGLWSGQSSTFSPVFAQATEAPTQTASATPIPLPQPDCKAPAALTTALTEGPFYKHGSPERASLLEVGITGTPIIITGYVLGKDCQPINHAWLDFWQANSKGAYDNTGFRLRGHQFTGADGRFSLTTIMPGEYPGRTVHIHVKIQAPNGPILTTQFFFPNVAANQHDTIFSPDLVLAILNPQTGQIGTAPALTQTPSTVLTATSPATLPAQMATTAATEEASPLIYTINLVVPTK